ncbi:MAG: TetM/TetW/TetO/TetS family tetracycline resistance ribosomal protection protein [Lachnospiraceae bacterium]|nr:TetM/TetW/TetO/TetS family tetracycline resistance ribosomal protection protein [Lachnospiraceae bacterium]
MHTDGEGQHTHSPEMAGKSSHLTAGTEENRKKRTCCTGLLAHVDAGKTTLAEAILYLTGRIRALGRVDHQDAFFDNFELERARGITIFSKQAQIELKGKPGDEDGNPGSRDGAEDLLMTLLDTPGHVDFSAEMERTLQVLDYAVLVISAPDGVQSHVETLWRLLARYEIPVFIFINKMDLPGTDRAVLMAELIAKLDGGCVDFSGFDLRKQEGRSADGTLPEDSWENQAAKSREPEGNRMAKGGDFRENQAAREEKFQEDLAMCDERLLEIYASGERIGADEIRRAIAGRQVFPCYFGSALKLVGVEELLEGIRLYSMEKEYPEAFGARVFKISRDAQGNRLTHMKITGGTLHVKDILTNEEKVNQIRMLSGASFETAQEAAAGSVCAVTGPEHTYVGQGLGAEPEAETPILEPVLSYRIELVEGTDVHFAYRQLKQLEEEEPQLHITWAPTGSDRGSAGASMSARSDRVNTGASMSTRSDRVSTGVSMSTGAGVASESGGAYSAAGRSSGGGAGEIHALLMGEVQTEVLQTIIRERFGVNVRFGEGSIVYRETIAAPVVGMGHFEPLRHYAEVHLLLEPGERGSGLQFESRCSTDELDLNWQRLVMTHLEEKQHLGVLTGSEITDMKITLIAGRAHQKHTEGGDFRQATYRAVRQGLCRAQSVLLEPVYQFRIEVPMESVGRALSDIQRMHGTAGAPVLSSGAFGGSYSQSGQAAVSGSAGETDDGTGAGIGDSGRKSGSVGQAGSSFDRKSSISFDQKSGGSPGGASDMMEITGTAPVVTMRGYQSELLAYTKGRGRLFCRLKGYEECHNAQEVIEARSYQPTLDLDNPCGSVFCAHGAGFVVDWEDVPDYVHIADTDRYAEEAIAGNRRGETLQREGDAQDVYPGRSKPARGAYPGGSEGARDAYPGGSGPARGAYPGGSEPARGIYPGGNTAARGAASEKSSGSAAAAEDELRTIFERTYGAARWEGRRSPGGKGPQARQDSGWAGYEASQTTRPGGASFLGDSGKDSARKDAQAVSSDTASVPGDAHGTRRGGKAGEPLEECLLVDGYNIIFAWDELKELSKTSLESARTRLLDLMCNYQGYKNNTLIVVFDAYHIAGHSTEVSRYHNIYVVYTKEAETADQYIEKTARQIRRRYHVTVATSDALEQIIILGAGAARLSARGLYEELEQMRRDLRENYLTPQKGGKAGLLDGQEDLKAQLPPDEDG